jgi:hypothetical protein
MCFKYRAPRPRPHRELSTINQHTLMLMGRSAGVCMAVRGLVCRTPRQTGDGAVDARRRAILGGTAMLNRAVSTPHV